tara:strand:- start:81202 stop:82836 length:1635 start_codon:yes stop_codon:yes gene_type:complete
MNKRFNKSLVSSLVSAIAVGTVSSVVLASSHREAPYIAKLPQVDGTDFYMFNSYQPGRKGYVTLLANYIPVQAPYGGPNYFTLDENALYAIHIDNDGDAREDITFEFRFSNSEREGGTATFEIGSGENAMDIPATLRNVGAIDANSAAGLNYVESYSLDVVAGKGRSSRSFVTDASNGSVQFGKPFDYAGTKTFGGPGNYAGYADNFIHTIVVPGCNALGKVFVGQRLESFKLALGEIFDLVNFVPVEGDSIPGAGDGAGFPGGITQDASRNALERNNITTLALEIPKRCLTGDGNGVIGAWTTASLRKSTILNSSTTLADPEDARGPWVQVSRLGNFLVNELFIGFPDKDSFNGSEPTDDMQFAHYVTHPVFPAIVDVLFRDAVNSTLGTDISNLAPVNIPRTDLVTGFLTGFPGVNQLATVTPSEMLRLNTAIPATARARQHPLGVAAGDLAGFPNGRRPGDDAVDIALRVAMGALCHDLPLGDNGAPVNLGICDPSDAPIGNVALTDGVPISALDFENAFPYLVSPYPGSPNNAPIPQPRD